MNKNIFINCPFDGKYENIFDALLFSIYFCGFKPRCALEIDNGSQIRLEKIFSIIEDCDLGVHDISRTQLNKNKLPRFNMPFEFGIFLGARRFGGNKQKQKTCIIFDTERFRFSEFISDISGQDIKSHHNNPEEVIRKMRNWLNSIIPANYLPGATAIIRKYRAFIIDKPKYLKELNLTKLDVQYADKTQLIEQWITLNPI